MDAVHFIDQQNLKRRRFDGLIFAFILFSCFFLFSSLSVGIENELLLMSCIGIIYLLPILIFGFHYKRYVHLLIFYSLIYVFQNTYLGVGLNLVNKVNYGNLTLSIAFSSVFGFLAFAALFIVFENKQIFYEYNHERIGILFVIFSVLYIFVGEKDFATALAYERNIILIVILPILSKIAITKRVDIEIFIKYTFFISFIIVIFGFVGEQFSIKTWYDYFHADDVFIAKGMTNVSYLNYNAPGFWTTTVFHWEVKRMVSFFYEPVNLSYFLSVAMLLAYMFKRKFLFIFFAFGTLLTFGKGGFILSLVTFLSVFLLKKGRNKRAYLKVFLFQVIFIFIFSYLYIAFFPGATLPHVWGLLSIPDNLIHNPLGHGMGSGGNFSSIFTGSSLYDTMHTGSESGLGTLTYKLGVIGFLLFIAYFISLGNHLYNVYNQNKNTTTGKLAIVSAGMIIGLLFGSVFQENALGPQANHMILLCVGVTLGISKLK